jgi:DNA-binding NarL/FixJ family response regulator
MAPKKAQKEGYRGYSYSCTPIDKLADAVELALNKRSSLTSSSSHERKAGLRCTGPQNAAPVHHQRINL